MKLTVLGKSPSWQDAGGACSGYLVEEGGTVVLLDCGNGVFAKLREAADYTAVSAVVISHLHADHILDLVPYAYALTYAPRQQPVPVAGWPGTDKPARPKLYLPSGGRDVLRGICGAWGPEAMVEEAFDLREYNPHRELKAGPLRITFCPVPHYIETYAIDVRSAKKDKRITYGADCAPNEELVAFAHETDLLVIEATLPRAESDGPRGHLTPSEAGDHGRRAKAARLLLTHISDELDCGWAHERATESFGAPVEIAAHGAVYEI